jgi:hypothetical protein
MGVEEALYGTNILWYERYEYMGIMHMYALYKRMNIWYDWYESMGMIHKYERYEHMVL